MSLIESSQVWVRYSLRICDQVEPLEIPRWLLALPSRTTSVWKGWAEVAERR